MYGVDMYFEVCVCCGCVCVVDVHVDASARVIHFIGQKIGLSVAILNKL